MLFLDAVDAVGPDRGSPFELYTTVDRLIRDTHAHPNLTLVMTCRQEDFDSDDRLRALLRDPTRVETVEVPPLSENQVRGAITTAGGDSSALSGDQIEILQFPNMLTLYLRIMGGGAADFSTREELLDRYYLWVTEAGS